MTKYTKYFRPAMSEQGQALVDQMTLYYRADLIEELLSGGKRPSGLGKGDRKSSVASTLVKHMPELSKKGRAKLAARMMRYEVGTKEPLSARDRLMLKRIVNPKAKTPLHERMKLTGVMSQIMEPDFELSKPVHFVKWTQGVIHSICPGPIGYDAPADDSDDDGTDGGTDSGTGSDGSSGPVVGAAGLRFVIDEMECLEATHGEWREDEMAFSGIAVDGPTALEVSPQDANGVIVPITQAGSFDEGDVAQYNTTLHTWSTSNTQMPHLFVFHLIMAEVDHGGFASALSDLYDDMEDEIADLIAGVAAAISTGALAGSLGGSIAGPLGTIIGALIGALLGAIVGFLVVGFQDDLFLPFSAALNLTPEALTGAPFFGSNETPQEETIVTGDGGRYRVNFHWELV